MVPETTVYSPFNHVTRLLARESLNEFSRRAVDNVNVTELLTMRINK
jgi:hypothetical protein